MERRGKNGKEGRRRMKELKERAKKGRWEKLVKEGEGKGKNGGRSRTKEG